MELPVDRMDAFRAQVRDFIRTKLPEDIRVRVERQEPLGREAHVRWHKMLVEHGWGAPGWPVEHGGCGWSLAQQYVFEQELAAHNAPRLIYFGHEMVGPTLMEYGTEEQRRRFLPPILTGDLWWCQGFSEPNAGSDLAALQCRAELDGEDYVINGSKIWTSGADIADWMFGLFRTDVNAPKKQLGITMLLIDMKTPGITIKPIVTFDGGAEVNQTFFDDVRTPAANRVGEHDKGWTIAKYMLSLERLGIAEVARSKAMLERLRRIAATERRRGKPLAEDPAFAEQMDLLEIDLLALEATEYRFLFHGESGDLGPESSILKIRGSELQQHAAELTVEALGYYALPDIRVDPAGANEPPIGPAHALLASSTYFNLRKISIYGGSNEIQKNIVTKAVLGL